jgi:hypothetical protein
MAEGTACRGGNPYDIIPSVPPFIALLISSLLAYVPSATREIGRACAADSAEALAAHFSRAAGLHVDLPDPISFSDRVSRDQAYFLFGRIFAVHKTFEFVPEPEVANVPGRQGFIFKARWSFRDTRNGSPYLFRVFFHLLPRRALGVEPGGTDAFPWEIVEIRAERQ